MRRTFNALMLAALLGLQFLLGAAAEAIPAPGRALSFLSDYVDALQVGDWYLACTQRTAEGRYSDATRNETANWRLLDEDGRVLADGLRWWPEGDAWPIQPRPFEGFEDGVDVAVLRVGQKYGLINRAGEIVAEAKYDSIFGFLPGDASTPAELDGKWGCIDAAGRVAVPFIYDAPFARFEGGVTVAERDGRYCLLGEDGTEVLPAIYDNIWLDEGAAYGMAHQGELCVLFNRQGEILFERELGANGWIYCYADAALPFAYNGKGERWGYLNLDGTEALDGAFEDAFPFWNGSDVAWVQVNGKQALIRRDGSFAVPPEYDDLRGYSEGLCAAQKDGLWGYLDEAGNVAIPFQFESADNFMNGYADVCPAGDEANAGENARPTGSAERHGLIDRSGNWAIEPMGCWHIDVGDDGVAVVTSDYGNTAYYSLGEDGFQPVGAIDAFYRSSAGYLPNEDGGKLARLDGAPTLSKRVSGDRLPHLDGAHRLYPLYAAFVQAIYPKDTTARGWSGYREDGNPILTYTGTETAWQRLSEGDADIIFVPAPDPDDPIWATLAGRGQEAEFTPLCREALVFPVNADNPVEDIAAARLEAVYSGAIADWSALGAAGLGDILAYQSGDVYDGAAAQAFEKLCGFENVAPAPEGVTGYNNWDGGAIVRAADYRNWPNALGYALSFDCKELLDAGEIRLLSVDGVAPSAQNIASGAYPYTQTLYAVRLADNDNPNVLALLDWITSDQGAELIQKTGYAPLA